MKSLKPWAKALKVSQDQYNQWVQQLPQEESITYWALSTGKVKAKEYFAWAIDYYKRPLLREDYFKAPPNKELWQAIQPIANWSQHMLPLDHWEGLIFIGCVEPLDEIQWSFPVCYVLAHPRHLKQRWKEFNTDSIDASEKNETPKASAKARPSETAVSEKPIDEEFTSDELISEVPTREEPTGIDFDTLAMDTSKALPDNAPMGLDLETAGSSASIPEEDNLDLAQISDSEIIEIPNNPDQYFHDDVPTKDIDPTPNNLEEETAQSNQAEQITAKSIELSEPQKEKPEPSVSPKSKPKPDRFRAPKKSVIDVESLEPESFEDISSNSELAAWAFSQAHKNFSSSMILLFKEDLLIPWKWEPNWKPQGEQALTGYNFSEPGIFRIVKSTGKPFHGPPVMSGLNQKFFKDWGFSSPPAHLTATPIFFEQHMAGILLSVADSRNLDLGSLREAEKLTKRVAEGFSMISSKKAS